MFGGLALKKKRRNKKEESKQGTAEEGTKSEQEKPSAEKEKDSVKRSSKKRRHGNGTSSAASQFKVLIHGFVENTLKKGAMGLRAEFLAYKRVNDYTKMTVFSKNQNKNRYKDVGCMDDTRVILKEGDNDYIHANYVSTPNSDKRFICCQAPLDNTCVDHWRMILQEKVEVILMLCNFTEKGAKKCAEYFPTSGDSKTIGTWNIKAVRTKKMVFPFSTSAVVNITSLVVEHDDKVIHSVDHYHWIDWPDRGVPTADLAPIHLLNKVMGTQNSVVVHCSAGIGRTGSIVLLQYTLESIAAGQKCETMDTLLVKLRKQRANSVQTDQQYLYVHQVLLNYFQKEGYLDKSLSPFLEGFSKEYKKAVIV